MVPLWACLLLLAIAACGAPDWAPGENEPESFEPEPPPLDIADIGKLEQALFLYTDYGMEQAGTMQRCSLPYSGGICAVPMTKTIYYYAYPWDQLGGCYGQFWNDAITSAVNGINAWNIAFQTQFSFVSVGANDPRISLYIWCDAPFQDASAQVMGVHQVVAWGHCQDHGSDEVCKVGAAWLRIAGNNLIEAALAIGASATQRNRKIENTVRHELGHSMGLAHFPLGAQSGTLMARDLNSYVLADPMWNQIKSPSNYEASLVWGYCPDGGTASCL